MPDLLDKIDLIEGERPCYCAPDCDGVAVVEQDGDHQWFECGECGYQFEWQAIQTQTLAVDQDGSCSIGVPEALRRAASAPMEQALRSKDKKTVDLGLTIPRRTDG